MLKLLKRLCIKNSGYKIPIYDQLKSDGWDLVNNTINHKYYDVYEITLKYNKSMRVNNDYDDPERYIKDLLFKELEWAIYGDTQRLLNYLKSEITMPIINKKNCLEIIGEIEREISGDIVR